jgi:hypothetical protein
MGTCYRKKRAQEKNSRGRPVFMNPIFLVLLGAIAGAVLTIGGQAAYDSIREAVKPRPDTRVYVQQVSDGLVVFSNNGGKTTDKVKIEISTKPYTITAYRVRRGGQIRLIEGGPVGNYAIFMIDELQPDTTQAIILATEAKRPDRLTAWSEYTGNITKVFKTPMTLEFGPEESYEEWQKKQ